MGISVRRCALLGERSALMPMLTSDPRSSFRAPSDVGFKTIAVSIHRPRFVPKSFEVGPLTNFSTSSNSIEEAFVFALADVAAWLFLGVSCETSFFRS